jgi:hypothetical protein
MTEEQTDAEEMVKVREQLRDAAEKLQRLKDKQAGVTRMSRHAWDNLTDHQRELLSEAVVRGTVVLEDSIREEGTWNN